MSNLYHYCSYETFEKIISNKTLRLSDITKSNDKFELNLFLIQHQIFDSPCEAFKYLKEDYNYLNYCIYLLNCYASCFSTINDKLSQWERYANKCTGVSISFDKEKLLNYINELTKSIKPDSIYFKGFPKMIAKKINYKKFESYALPVDLFANRSNVYDFLENSCFTKHNGFHEENEFRVAILFAKDETNFLEGEFSNYVSNSNNNYIDIQFPTEIIKEITLGPLFTAKDTKEIEDFLSKNNVKCKIKKSFIPYNPFRNSIKV